MLDLLVSLMFVITAILDYADGKTQNAWFALALAGIFALYSIGHYLHELTKRG